MKTPPVIITLACLGLAGTIIAQPFVIVTQGEEFDLAATYDAGDLIQGLIPTELPGDRGWHPVNTDPADQLPAFTDGEGIRFTGLTGLLNDFPGAGLPAKLVAYELPVPADIHEIRVFTGNEGRDGRVFHTYTARFSSDGGQTFGEPVYVQSHFSGSLNNAQNNAWRVALSQLTDVSVPLATQVTHVEFGFYAVDNTGGEMRDPFDGLNPFNQTDDLFTPAFVSPLVWEIDVLGTDSPPRLVAIPAGTELQLAWLSRATSFIVQGATRLDPPDWTDLSPQPAIATSGFSHITGVPWDSESKFFRLQVVNE
jgi:hypothetical protein